MDVSQQWNTAFGTKSYVVKPWEPNSGDVTIHIGQNPQFYSSTVFPRNNFGSTEVWCQATNTNQTTDQGKQPATSLQCFLDLTPP